ncbi:MAG: hypothetical protein ACM3N9_01200 [Syntrophothermus sp.]
MSIIPTKARWLLLLLVLATFSLHAQIRIASPYSRFGIGDLSGNTNAWNLSMGGIGTALRSPYHINLTNPASYSAFDSNAFIFEGGFLTTLVTLESNLQSSSRNYGSLGYLVFGLPVTKWWHTSFGITPFSDVGYHIAVVQKTEGIGSVTRSYIGEGGINRFFWGNSFRIFKNLSLGVNSEYLFGTIKRQALAIFPDSIYFADMELTNEMTVHAFHFNFGAQAQFKIGKDINLLTGATFAAETKMRATTDMLARTFFLSTSGTQYFKDTIASTEGYSGKVVLPMMLNLGFAFEKPDKWLAGADVKWQNWEKYSAFGISDSLVNSLQVNAGAEFLPDINSYSNYLKRIRYRIGVNYNSTYLQLREQNIKEYGFSVGFGLPLRGSKTGLNLGAQFGTRGTTDNGLIKETYFRFVVGFSIYEKWFVKRKYY